MEFLKAHHVKVVAATSERIVKTLDDSNTKQVTFHFVQFREFLRRRKMAEKHILLTGYSTVSSRLDSNRSNGHHDSAKRCMVNNKNATWEIQEIPSEFEGLHLNSAYTTSETVF